LHNYDHKRLIETIAALDKLPPDAEEFAEWIKAGAHLNFIRENARYDELVVRAVGEYTFVDSLVVPNELLTEITPKELRNWQFDSHSPIAGYTYGGGKEEMWIERGVRRGYEGHQNGMQLVFIRTFEGWSGSGRNYIEINQEYTHLADIHWRPEKRAYCHYNQRGDIESVVSVTHRDDKGSDMTLASFKWEQLEEYLSVANASLVRRFDFTLVQHESFGGWPRGGPEFIQESEDFFYDQLVMPGYAAYTSGVQIIRTRRRDTSIQKDIKDGWSGRKNKKYAEFIAYDWRNQRIVPMSTDPAATTNYFEAKDNKLPFELSPAFFRPEVLSKYKTDRDKYTLGERDLTCRAAWHLKGIDVNEAGQVHAYIGDLRALPYEEQLHWLAHNEEPKTSISQRAYVNDFQGEFVHFTEPPAQLLSMIQRWYDKKVPWWKLRDEKLLDRINTPLTSSRDEWAEAFMDLAKLVVEGFETTPLRKKLDATQISYDREKDRTIALLEKLLNVGDTSGEFKRLTGLRTVQNLRSKAKGHAGGGEAEELAEEALMEHETFANHFKYVCKVVFEELEMLEKLLAQK
jgi:hypothetical protein